MTGGTIDPTLPIGGYWASLEQIGLTGRITASGIDIECPVWHFIADAPTAFNIVSSARTLHAASEEAIASLWVSKALGREVEVAQNVYFIAGVVLRAQEHVTLETAEGARIRLTDEFGARRPTGPDTTETLAEGMQVVATVVFTEHEHPRYAGCCSRGCRTNFR